MHKIGIIPGPQRPGAGWRRRVAARVAALAGSVAFAAGFLLPVVAPAAHADVVYNQKITRSEVIARAQFWYDKHLTYSQNTTSDDPSGTAYRDDCSGYISMTWHLDPTGLSAPNTDKLATSTYTTRLSSSPSSGTDLQAGDILDDPGVHAFLFDKWADSSHSSFYAYSFGGTPVTFEKLSFSDSKWYTHARTAYDAYRYKNIIDDSPATAVSGKAYTSGDCSSPASYPVPGVSGLAIEETPCEEQVDGPSHETLYVSEDISWTGGGSDKLDGYTLHIQAQKSNVTEDERYCSGIESDINAHASGSESCYFAITDPSPGTWSADGWLHPEPHGGNWQGPQYAGGAGNLTF